MFWRLHDDTVWKILCLVVLLLVLKLGGCGNVDLGGAQAQAQVGREMRTYEISPTTFELQSDTEPTITVIGEATEYKLVDDGRVLFTPTDGSGGRNFVLDSGDTVIERPLVPSITVVTQENRLF